MTMLAEKTGAGIAGKMENLRADGWNIMREQLPEKYGRYRVMRRRLKGLEEDELLWNGSSFVTERGSLTMAVDAWKEAEAPAAGASADGTALASADAGTMTEAERASAVARYEARIQLYKEQIGTGYIGIGRTLNEAKAAQVVPHGQWESWVTQTTGLTPRQAQRCMQAATEIRDGSALAQLEMSKAILLLGSGLDEETREEIAGKAAEEGATVKALREEIRKAKEAQAAADAENAETVKALKLQVVRESGAAAEIREALKKAQAERDEIEQQMTAAINEYRAQMDNAVGDAYRRGMTDQAEGLRADLRKEFQGKIDYINGERKRAEETIGELRERLQKMEVDGRHAWDYGFEAGKKEAAEIRREVDGKRKKEIDNLQEALDASEKELEGVRKEADNLRRNQGDLLAAAEDAEKRAADAEAELAKLRAGGPEGAEPAWKVLRTASDRFLADCEMLPIWDAPGVIRGEAQITPILEKLEQWILVMRDTLAGVVASEGAVL